MSGHSKWSTIKRQKAVTDARRSASFTKLGRLITVAARAGGGDPEMNFGLRLAIDKARAANMPNDNIGRAIKAGTGELHGEQAKEAVYEGFGPNGVAILVETVTDNHNRTAADLRIMFSKHGGSLGSHNSVAWMFTSRGAVRLSTATITTDRDALTLAAIDAGAEDVLDDGDQVIFFTPPANIGPLKDWFTKQGLAPVSASPELIPNTTAPVSEHGLPILYALLEELDQHPDVTNVITNEA